MEPRVRDALVRGLAERLRGDPRLRGWVSSAELAALEASIGLERPSASEPRPEAPSGPAAGADENHFESVPAAGADQNHFESVPAAGADETHFEPAPAAGADVTHFEPASGFATAPVRSTAEAHPLPGPRPHRSLDHASLDRAPAPGWTACLDFGTATGKAALSRGGRDPRPLRLDDEGFAADACAYVDRAGRVWFGAEARRRSEDEGGERVDSLKRLLGRAPVERDLDRLGLEELGSRAGGGLSLGDAVRLHLAWLVGRLDEAYPSVGLDAGRPRLRYAVPCWPRARARALVPVLRRWLADAISVADTLGPEVDRGLALDDARALLLEARARPERPTALIGSPVLEPVAAAAARFAPDAPLRALVLVVDVGAGTTDLAVFTVEADPDEARFEVRLLDRGVDMLAKAGDTVDRALTELVNRQLGDAGCTRTRRLELQRRVRWLKEDLLRSGRIELQLDGMPVEVTKDALLDHPEIAGLESLLRTRIQALLARVDPAEVASGPPLLTVCLAGGGAFLPGVAALVHGTTAVGARTLEHRPGPALPRWVGDHPELLRAYPRLAVALGGASGYLPDTPEV